MSDIAYCFEINDPNAALMDIVLSKLSLQGIYSKGYNRLQFFGDDRLFSLFNSFILENPI